MENNKSINCNINNNNNNTNNQTSTNLNTSINTTMNNSEIINNISLNKAAHLLGCNELNKFDYKSLNSIRKLAKTLGCNEYDLMKSFNNLKSLFETNQKENLSLCKTEKLNHSIPAQQSSPSKANHVKVVHRLLPLNITRSKSAKNTTKENKIPIESNKDKQNETTFKRTIVNKKKLPSKFNSLKAKSSQAYEQQKQNKEANSNSKDGEKSNQSNNNNNNFVKISPKREVILIKDENLGFGFIAGSERPLKIRFVTPDGPGKNKLLNGDEILAVNDEDVEFASRDYVINLIRNSNDKIKLVVKQPTPKSNNSLLLTEDKKAFKKEINSNRKNKVRFRLDGESIDETISNHQEVKKENQNHEQVSKENKNKILDNKEKIILKYREKIDTEMADKENNDMQNEDFSILRVYLENQTIKSFKYDQNTLVKDVLACLKEKLSIEIIEYFGLVIRLINDYDCVSKYIIVDETQHLYKIREKFGDNTMCMFRFLFVPGSYKELIENDQNAFNYLYEQSVNDVLRGRYGSEIKYEMVLHLTTLSILHQHSTSNSIYNHTNSNSAGPFINMSFLENEEEFDQELEKCLPKSILESNLLKRKDLKKLLVQNINWFLEKLNLFQNNKMNIKLEYLNCMKELLQFSGRIFFVYLLDQMKETFIIIGAEYGIATFIDLKTKTLLNLAKFDSIENIRVSNNIYLNFVRVDLDIFETNMENNEESIINKTITFGFLQDDYLEFLYILQGYLRILVFPIKNRLCPIQEIKSNSNQNLNIPVYLVKFPQKANNKAKKIEHEKAINRANNNLVLNFNLDKLNTLNSVDSNDTTIKPDQYDDQEREKDHENEQENKENDEYDENNVSLKKKLHKELLDKLLKKEDENEDETKEVINQNELSLSNKSEEDFYDEDDEDVDHIINYDTITQDDYINSNQFIIKNLNGELNLNDLDNENLALIESFQLFIQNDNYEEDKEEFENSVVEEQMMAYEIIKNELDEASEELKSISSIEGSLKGLSNLDGCCASPINGGINSSTPLLHLYPKLGI